jgi:hypothetical protein
MPLDDIPERTQEELDNGPTPNGDLASWFYVLGGIPMMAVFFVVMFLLVGYCDGSNVMLHG